MPGLALQQHIGDDGSEAEHREGEVVQSNLAQSLR